MVVYTMKMLLFVYPTSLAIIPALSVLTHLMTINNTIIKKTSPFLTVLFFSLPYLCKTLSPNPV